MKKFTFVLAATALCVNVGFARTFEPMNRLTPVKQVAIEKIEKSSLSRTLPGTVETKFDFVRENQKRVAKKPAQVAALTAPEALPATNVTASYFVANWNAVSGANYYEVDTYRTFTTAADSVEYCALYEDFYFAEASDESITNYLNGSTYRSQWVLIDGKLGDQSVILPAAAAEGCELDTPPLDLTAGGETGNIHFSLSLEGNTGDKVYIGYYYDENGESKAYALGALTLDDGGLEGSYSVPDLPLTEESGLFLYTKASENTGDIKVNGFVVSQTLAPGLEFTAFHDYATTTGTSAQVFTMERDVMSEGVTDNFFYGVFALNVNMATGQVTDASNISNLIDVDGQSGVEGVQVSNDKIFVHDNLHVVLERPATIAVYNMAGVLVMSVEGVEGENEIALPAAGAYIVKAGNTVAKVMK